MPMKANSTKILVESSNVRYSDDFIEADFAYETCQCEKDEAKDVIRVVPTKTLVTFKTGRKVPKMGLMLVGWGGNNGTTVTGAILANKHRMRWMTKSGLQEANYFGSITQSSTVLLGKDSNGQDLFVPMNDLLPMVNPNDIVVDGWDISGLNLYEAMRRAQVLDVNLQELLKPYLQEMKPRKGIYDPDFIAANQNERADNVIPDKDKWAQVCQIREDIRDFKAKHKLDTVIVLWTANTERFTNVMPGIHDTADNLLEAIKANCDEIAPSTLFAVSALLEECTYINGSPQNTFVPGVIELAEKKNVFIAGDDFKSGQTKMKSVLVDFLVNAGIKPCSIASYNHLGNNDGKNLSAPQQFRSKEISKSNVVDDMVHSNKILFGKEPRRPDHCVVIKYVPYVGDSKRAMDEYVSELMLGGQNTIIIHNTCEDSLLASPLILDLAILAELCQRVEFKIYNPKGITEYQKFNAVLSVLSYMCKAPLVERGANVVNSLFRQRTTIENMLRALLSLPPLNHLDLQSKCSQRSLWYQESAESIFSRKSQSQKLTANSLNASFNGIDGTIKGF